MKKLGLLLLAVGLYVIPAQAATTESQMQNVFVRSEAALNSFTTLCDKQPNDDQDAILNALLRKCAADVRATHDDLLKHKALHESGDLTGDSRKAWLRSHRSAYLRVEADLNQIASRLSDNAAQPISSFIDPLHPKKQLVEGVTCGDVLAAATAMCAMYLLAPFAGEFLSAACEAAAIAGYISCLQDNRTAIGAGGTT